MGAYFFTFGQGQEHGGRVQKIIASSYTKARELMFAKYGGAWCFQYSEADWEEAKHQAEQGGYRLEREMDSVIVEGEN